MRSLVTETRSELITKIVRTLELQTHEIADIVSLYYDCQDLRIAHSNKDRTEGESELVQWLDFWMGAGESVIAGKLKSWLLSDKAPAEAKWAHDQVGIGPIIAAGLSAHIDVAKADSISAVWKFAGQAPGYDKKVKGRKLPYNARLKVLCWKAGESFVKISGKEEAVYGQLYKKFKAEEVARNESGCYAQAAKEELAAKKFKTDNATKKRLLEGRLSDAHLHARAKRRAVKMFLADYWTVGRKARGLAVREPYAIEILGHSGKIDNLCGDRARERVLTSENPKEGERARGEDKPMRRERAITREKPSEQERVMQWEKPITRRASQKA